MHLNDADMILVPASYNGKDYGGKIDIPKRFKCRMVIMECLFGMILPKYSQAYTLIANYIDGTHDDSGQSAVYSLVPEDGYYPPQIAPQNQLPILRALLPMLTQLYGKIRANCWTT